MTDFTPLDGWVKAEANQIDPVNDFNPGDGWREVPDKEFYGHQGDHCVARIEGQAHYFVRVAPVPSLPTEPYTVIRVTLTSGIENEYVRENGRWWEVNGDHYLDDGDITGFEVLAEPRAETEERIDGFKQRIARVERENRALLDRQEEVRRETAKAVLDDVRGIEYKFLLDTRALLPIYKKFGVES